MKTTGSAYRKHQKIGGSFDVVVIGCGMGGLSVSSLRAQEGTKVLLLEQNNDIGDMTQAYSRPSPARFDLMWLRAETPVKGLYLTGQDVASDGVVGALVGGVLAASAYLTRDLMTEIRAAK